MASNYTNTRVLLAKRPVGEPQQEHFTIETVPLRELQEGEVLIKVLWLSLDPYMRGRMSDRPSYVKPVDIGEVMQGETAGRIIQSRSEKFAEGEYVCCHLGWQTYVIARDNDPSLFKVDPTQIPLSVYLHAAGMPGRTAYLGLERLGKPKEGETLVVSAAAGAVGSVVGQIGKMKGCRVIGVAGGPAKCQYVVQDLGFDDCVDYKAGRLENDLQATCPRGIDIYWENVGGAVAKAVALLFNKGARVPICGSIANYNLATITEEVMSHTIFSRSPNPPFQQYFVVTDFYDGWLDATVQLVQWVKEGKIKYRESIIEGIENAPAGLRGLLRGENFGKQLVHIAD